MSLSYSEVLTEKRDGQGLSITRRAIQVENRPHSKERLIEIATEQIARLLLRHSMWKQVSRKESGKEGKSAANSKGEDQRGTCAVQVRPDKAR
jgi:hypothetical protein